MFATAILAPILLVGCATTGPNVDPGRIVADGCLIASNTVPPVINLSLQYAVASTNRAALEAQIFTVAVNVHNLATTGVYSPVDLAAAFKVSDVYINALLSTIPTFYNVLYQRFPSAVASNALAIVDCIAADVADATSPEMVRKAEEQGLARGR